jgi:hypothetical protein
LFCSALAEAEQSKSRFARSLDLFPEGSADHLLKAEGLQGLKTLHSPKQTCTFLATEGAGAKHPALGKCRSARSLDLADQALGLQTCFSKGALHLHLLLLGKAWECKALRHLQICGLQSNPLVDQLQLWDELEEFIFFKL